MLRIVGYELRKISTVPRRYFTSSNDAGKTIPQKQKDRAEEQIRKWLKKEKERRNILEKPTKKPIEEAK